MEVNLMKLNMATIITEKLDVVPYRSIGSYSNVKRFRDIQMTIYKVLNEDLTLCENNSHQLHPNLKEKIIYYTRIDYLKEKAQKENYIPFVLKPDLVDIIQTKIVIELEKTYHVYKEKYDRYKGDSQLASVLNKFLFKNGIVFGNPTEDSSNILFIVEGVKSAYIDFLLNYNVIEVKGDSNLTKSQLNILISNLERYVSRNNITINYIENTLNLSDLVNKINLNLPQTVFNLIGRTLRKDNTELAKVTEIYIKLFRESNLFKENKTLLTFKQEDIPRVQRMGKILDSFNINYSMKFDKLVSYIIKLGGVLLEINPLYIRDITTNYYYYIRTEENKGIEYITKTLPKILESKGNLTKENIVILIKIMKYSIDLRLNYKKL